jgi:hypothetical protein
MANGTAEPLPKQVAFFVREIQVRQASRVDLDTAAEDTRLHFEEGIGLSDDQRADLEAAKAYIAKQFKQPVEFLKAHTLRKGDAPPPWYAGPAATDRLWPKLRAYLRGVKDWSEDTVGSIDRTSTEVVSMLANPAQTAFRGRGLVVGYVQSGKTANMTAVISKAVDAGYRLIIVLAGLTNSLRLQTQIRIEDDLIARDEFAWIKHTWREMDGDFRIPPAQRFLVNDDAQIAVIKKNVTPLNNLLRMLQRTPNNTLSKLPVLIIDDECDQASVNSSEYDITSINRLIRQILQTTPRVQYVGYTATPFANVLINPYNDGRSLDDLYPDDFITALPKPDGYFGTLELFGEGLLDAGAEADGYDMIRDVPDAETDRLRPPSRAAMGGFEPELTPSLEAALRYFLLVNACRLVRGQHRQHSSMLVHTTVYTLIHKRLKLLIGDWKTVTLNLLAKKDAALLKALRAQWEDEHPRVASERFGQKPVSFDELTPHLHAVLDDTQIVVENSVSDERLDYQTGPGRFIVVGGSVLARGLTIEGLSVSYFLRSSNQYDTLLQMGRWFGFRGGYQDLPRIWMPKDLLRAFRDMARVELEIRDDIAQYIRRGVTPRDFAVRIREIPGMAITAPNKMFAARRCDISFSNQHVQTIRFRHTDDTIIGSNRKAAAALLTAAAATASVETVKGRGRLFRGTPGAAVEAFLSAYRHEPNFMAHDLLAYLKAEGKKADRPFETWNVGVVEPDGGEPGEDLGPLKAVRRVSRARMKDLRDGAADIKALMSKTDVLIDGGAPATGEWADLKAARNAAVGSRTPLLLLYVIDAASQPKSAKSDRLPLGASGDLIGVGVVMPDRGVATSFVSVALRTPDADEVEDLAAELEAETAA